MKNWSHWLKVSAFVFLIALLFPPFVKKRNSWEDKEGPHTGEAAWHPYCQYTPDVERGLSILGTVDPSQVSYLRSRGFPVVFVQGRYGRMADTTPQGVIEIPARFKNEPAQVAVLLAHEIVHEQRHDPYAPRITYPLWRRLLWHEEEEVAHIKSFWIALALWPRYHSVWAILGMWWILEPYLFFVVTPAAILAIVGLAFIIYGEWNTFVQISPSDTPRMKLPRG